MKTTVKINFTDFNTNNKNEQVIKLTVRGELSDEQILTIYKLKKQGVGFVDLFSAQTDIDDFEVEEEEEDHDGIEYTINGNGTVDADSDQVSIDDVPDEAAAKVEEQADIILPDDIDPIERLIIMGEAPEIEQSNEINFYAVLRRKHSGEKMADIAGSLGIAPITLHSKLNAHKNAVAKAVEPAATGKSEELPF
ncbi:hypothetical protein [Paenibacillus sp. FJAT-26967]|uniref:hypothetical protein n=1 Tax=Paenibacillus sp. FJAT-26967 TaxID=1729690 RepID=UPI0008389B9B|nr:hypothetical protein [Paenibacillus sp. FJAT-26967]